MTLVERLKSNRTVRSFLLFLAVLGPGIVTGSVDNDAGGITTYSVAGASYGYHLLWTLIPSFILLLVVQEMNARMGVVTGKGLADLIRENFGLKVTFVIFLGLVVADIGNTATEFAGVAGSMTALGVSKYISVPVVAVGVWLLVSKGNYRTAERIFLFFSFCLLSYVVSAVLARPDWAQVGTALVRPRMRFDVRYLSMVLGIVGTTIAPWMQFYMQSAVIEKGIKIEKYRYAVWDVVIGCVATVVVAFFIMVACAATLHVKGIVIHEAKDAAMALQPLAGPLAAELFAFGLFIASVFSAAILPLATAFYVCEAFGFEAGINKKIREAPQFYTLFGSIMGLAVLIILIPGAPLIGITIWSQVLNAVMLPIVLVSMIRLVNDRKIMGSHVNKPVQNAIGWTSAAVLLGLTAALLLTQLIGAVGRR
ncbi:MAG TPA: Nramp family divalent metal transporter [Candidatus Aminicenantes bacterium]|nr:Nramp family divalent metal transporter [Candidatus Aminicenantes bacterium]